MDHLQNLKKRYKDINGMTSPKWIIDMVYFDVLSEQEINLIIAQELLQQKGNKVLTRRIQGKGFIG